MTQRDWTNALGVAALLAATVLVPSIAGARSSPDGRRQSIVDTTPRRRYRARRSNRYRRYRHRRRTRYRHRRYRSRRYRYRPYRYRRSRYRRRVKRWRPRPTKRRRRTRKRNYKYYPIELALVSPIHLFHPKHKTIIGLSLNLIYGRTHRAFGLEIGTANHDLDDFGGIQLGGILNLVGWNAYGIQVAGLVNYLRRGDVLGLQLSGAVNYGAGSCSGICVAGFANIHGDLSGLHISSSVNWLKGHGKGLQLTMGYNRVNGQFKGVQIGGGNHTLGHFSGVQIAAFANVNNTLSSRISDRLVRTTTYFADVKALQISSITNANYNFHGLQIAGIANAQMHDQYGVSISLMFNYTKNRMHGVQISATNIARHVRGAQIGLINVTKYLSGFQLGALNIAYGMKWPFMVGFLPGWDSARRRSTRR